MKSPFPQSVLLLPAFGLALCGSVQAAPALQNFQVRDYLDHAWDDELVHFDIDVAGKPAMLGLTDETGKSVSSQITDLYYDSIKKRTTGKIWTVVSLPPGGKREFQLRSGQPRAEAKVQVEVHGDELVLRNDRLAVKLARWPGVLKMPASLVSLPAPLVSVSQDGTNWLGTARWFDGPQPLTVREATTTIVENGPVRCTIRQQLRFASGGTYVADITLGARQDAALVSEDSTVDAPQAGFRLDLNTGLQASRVLLNTQEGAIPPPYHNWNKANIDADFSKENVICSLRPWTFWWLGGITPWAGFYRPGADDFVGVVATHPSHWTPTGWDGFGRTAIPVTAGPDHRLDLTFGLVAQTGKTGAGVPGDPAGNPQSEPLHREWAITAGKVSDNNVGDPIPGGPQSTKLRRQLLKYSEFPLDQVKDFHFDFASAESGRRHPCLLFTPEDVARVRRQIGANPNLQRQFAAARPILDVWRKTYAEKGEAAFLDMVHLQVPPTQMFTWAYMAETDPVYAKMAAAITRDELAVLKQRFLDDPGQRPSIGANGPWRAGMIVEAVLDFDLLEDADVFTPEEKAKYRAEIVFLEYWLNHPDYWNFKRGMASANPNMTSSIVLARGTVGLWLAGHPRQHEWIADAEEELKAELKNFVSPGGAWMEDPGYQSVSLDAIFMLSQGLKNIEGKDYFQDPNFKATMDYYGFLLTAPDRRFKGKDETGFGPMVLPSIGDMFSGFVTPFNGWMAKSTENTDPGFSKRQQFYWQAQGNFGYGSVSGDNSYNVAVAATDADLPAQPPAETARSFPGFGNLLRGSWTDPRASYISHRAGPNLHHYHDDFGSIVYYAKGAPLCLDFGNCYAPVRRAEPYYHNRVSFDVADSPAHIGSSGSVLGFASLPSLVDYSASRTQGFGGQVDDRHLLMLTSADPLGANYVVIRDSTVDGQPNQQFYWNLWCLSHEPRIERSQVHFPGQFDVDLDVNVLAPANPKITTDHWQWTQSVYLRGNVTEEQYAMRVAKSGSKEDFLAVLYPRAAGQAAAKTTILGDNAGLHVDHSEGTDVILLSPNAGKTVTDGDVTLTGLIAVARRTKDGEYLATVQGESSARSGHWQLTSGGPTAVRISGLSVEGETSGAAHQAVLQVPEAVTSVSASLDGNNWTLKIENHSMSLELPAGSHHFVLNFGP